MKNQNNSGDLKVQLGEMIKSLPDDVVSSAMDLAIEKSEEALKKNEEVLNGLSGPEREKQATKIRLDTFSALIVGHFEAHQTFVHANRWGYWVDKLIQSGCTIGMAVAVAAVVMKVTGKREAEAVVEPGADANPNANPFQTTATDRPIRSAREIKTA